MPDNPGDDYLLEIITKYLDGNATAEETKFIQSYYAWFDKNPEILNHLSAEELKQLHQLNLEGIWSKVREAGLKQKPKTLPILRRTWIRAAAAAAVLLVGGLWYWNATNKQPGLAQKESQVNDVQPGTTGAILTLADGKKLILDSSGNGVVANQGDAGVVKTNAGIAYRADNRRTTAGIIYNTLATPRTQTYSITLSDGTKLWLNAESSVTYPAVFIGDERRVKISGEVYFEVAKNAGKPFFVEFNDREIKVLGTQFNVNTYKTETAMQTTLIEGSVQYTAKNQRKVLKPGEQLQDRGENIQLIKNVNTESVVAWKNGYFLFEDAVIDEVMNQLKRWYDIEVIFDGRKPSGHYAGEISRNTSLRTVLELLNRSGISATLNNKKIIVKSSE